MSDLVVLDTGPLGLFVHPTQPPLFKAWVSGLGTGGVPVAVPEISHYELRRELLRMGQSTSLRMLEAFVRAVRFLPADSAVFTRAAELWAQARREGRPTADARALDGDMLLAATVQLLREDGVDAVIATTNVRHLAPFVPAYEWQTLDPRSGSVIS